MRWNLIEAYAETPSRKTRGGGIAYLINLEFDEIGKTFQCIIPYGEFEYDLPYEPVGNKFIRFGMSGCAYYTKTHTTMSGYKTYKYPILLGQKDGENKTNGYYTEINDDEIIFINRVLANNIVEFLYYLYTKGEISDEEMETLFTKNIFLSSHIPLWRTYKRSRIHKIEINGAKVLIVEIPNSWKSQLFVCSDWYNPNTLDNPTSIHPNLFITSYVLNLTISKTRRFKYIRKDNILKLFFKKMGTEIEFTLQSFPDMHKLVYYYADILTAVGGEVYRNIVHREITLDRATFDDLYYYLLHRRLGDLLFMPTNTSSQLVPAEEQHLQKVKLVDGKLEKRDVGYIAQGALYHPEHGFIYIEEESKIMRLPTAHD